jgi:ATP-binding cassette subfamily B protein
LRRALSFAFPYRRSVLVIFLLTLLIAGINAVEPLWLKFIFDSLTAGKPAKKLLTGVGLLVGFGVLREAAGALSNWLAWHAKLGIHYAVLDSTVERLHRMPWDFHRTEGVGAIITRLDRSINGYVDAVSQVLLTIFPAVLYLGISVFIMLHLNWKLALLVFFFLPLPGIMATLAGRERVQRERSLMHRWSAIYSRFNEVLSGIVTVRSFAMEDAEKNRLLSAVSEAHKVGIRGVGIDSGLGAATNMVINLARIAAILFGGLLILHGKLSLGALVAFLGYVGGLFGPVQGLTNVFQTIQRAYVSVDEIFSILDTEEHLGDAPHAKDLTRVRGEVAFNHVKFRYKQASKPLLQGVDLKVNAGESIAIVGPSGSGKTTLMSLMMRFHDPESGAVLIDGQDVKTLKQRSLRQNIGVILQDPLLFNDTVRNNIAYGRPNGSPAEIEHAARAAHAHDFIARLPDGYETMAGERGARFSVGERQRLTIARALIKNPPILVLDEATSALDAESETLVQDALEHLMKDRTTFVIAHRLSTVVNSDRIIVLKNGQIHEIGTHRQLMGQGGYYADLVSRQTRGLFCEQN